MKQTVYRGIAAFAVLAALALWSVDEAQAGRRNHSSGGSNGSWGSHGSSGGYYSSRGGLYHSSGGSHGSWGSSGGSWGSSGGSWGSSGGSWGSSGGYTYYSHGSSGSSGGVYRGGAVYGGGVIQGGAAPAAPPPAGGSDLPVPGPDAPNGAKMDETSAMLEVEVPSDAKIFVNGRTTQSQGRFRRYISHGLNKGYEYAYTVRAVATRDGEQVEETQVVEIRPGQSKRLAFELDPQQPPRTTLTLNVPEDAEVTLSGTSTNSTGSVRKFTTTTLKHGEKWENYLVKVSVAKEGRQMTQERAITLKAGDVQTLTFDMDAPKFADAR